MTGAGGMGQAAGEERQAAKGRRPLVVAHRGGAGLAPENTLAAFRRALDLGVDAVEMDVRLSRDGQPVVIHDATIDRTMEGRGRVSAMPLATLQALRARAGGGGGVPALREVLALGRENARFLVDVKTDDGEPHRAIEAKLLSAVQPGGGDLRVTFVSFDLLCLRRLRELHGGASLGILVSWGFFRAHGRAAADRLVEEAQGVRAERIGVHHELATPELLAEVRGAGFATDVWTVNDPSVMRRLALLGVDGLITDRPDLLLHVLAELPADAPGA
ncbi:MAG TPA: glycerophosphodiester phosphodiesterase family protein [Candidatus Methylomirabilis sp.]